MGLFNRNDKLDEAWMKVSAGGDYAVLRDNGHLHLTDNRDQTTDFGRGFFGTDAAAAAISGAGYRVAGDWVAIREGRAVKVDWVG